MNAQKRRPIPEWAKACASRGHHVTLDEVLSMAGVLEKREVFCADCSAAEILFPVPVRPRASRKKKGAKKAC